MTARLTDPAVLLGGARRHRPGQGVLRWLRRREACLAAAVARREPWGVWGGELFVNGKVIANKRRRGRPPKHPRPEDTLPRTGSYRSPTSPEARSRSMGGPG